MTDTPELIAMARGMAGDRWDTYNHGGYLDWRAEWIDRARAALLAIRDLSPEAVEAGLIAAEDYFVPDLITSEGFRIGHTAIIDHMLGTDSANRRDIAIDEASANPRNLNHTAGE